MEVVEVTLFFDPLATLPSQTSITTSEITGLLSAIENALNQRASSLAGGGADAHKGHGHGHVSPTANHTQTSHVKITLENSAPNTDLLIKADGCKALDICIASTEVWKHIDALQDEIYNPESTLNTKFIKDHKIHPIRAYVKEARVSYGSVSEITKESVHTKLAAIAAKQAFFKLAKQEIATREALAESLIVAQNSKEKLDQMSAMFDEIAATCTDPDQVKKGFDLLKATHTAVQENARIVSLATAEAIELHKLSEEAKLAAYFCSARTGAPPESFHEWARREFVFTYLPKDILPDSSQSKFVSERDKAIAARIEAEKIERQLSLAQRGLSTGELDPHSVTLNKKEQEANLRRLEEQRTQAQDSAEKAIRMYQESLEHARRNPVAKPPEPLYTCSLGTGFIGTFKEVDEHEKRVLAERRAKGGH